VKRCPHCKTVKPATDFHINHDRTNTLQSWCKACKVESTRQHRASMRTEPKVRLWRPPHGERHYLAKLTNEDVRLIRGLLPYLSCAEIGRKFEVSRQLISDIKHGRKWTEVA
jgi:hypothetical protein